MLNFKEFMAIDPIVAYNDHLAAIEAHLTEDDYAPDIAWGLLNQANPVPVTPEQLRRREELRKILRAEMPNFLRRLKDY